MLGLHRIAGYRRYITHKSTCIRRLLSFPNFPENTGSNAVVLQHALGNCEFTVLVPLVGRAGIQPPSNNPESVWIVSWSFNHSQAFWLQTFYKLYHTALDFHCAPGPSAAQRLLAASRGISQARQTAVIQFPSWNISKQYPMWWSGEPVETCWEPHDCLLLPSFFIPYWIEGAWGFNIWIWLN